MSAFSVGALRIPETVRDAVRGRVAGLREPTQVLLHAAALFPGDVHLATVRDVAGLDEEEAVDAVDEALAAGLLQTTGRASAPYAFAHAIVRHALGESHNPDRAARMHRRAAEALARLRPHDTEASLLAVRCPLLHVSGSFPSDRDRLRALCPQLEVADVHGRGHFIQLTAAEEVNAVLAHFLARVTGSVTSTSSGQGGLRATVGPTRPR